jgi:hypothetical protein
MRSHACALALIAVQVVLFWVEATTPDFDAVSYLFVVDRCTLFIFILDAVLKFALVS